MEDICLGISIIVLSVPLLALMIYTKKTMEQIGLTAHKGIITKVNHEKHTLDISYDVDGVTYSFTYNSEHLFLVNEVPPENLIVQVITRVSPDIPVDVKFNRHSVHQKTKDGLYLDYKNTKSASLLLITLIFIGILLILNGAGIIEKILI